MRRGTHKNTREQETEEAGDTKSVYSIIKTHPKKLNPIKKIGTKKRKKKKKKTHLVPEI